jgi:hypothetical protein
MNLLLREEQEVPYQVSTLPSKTSLTKGVAPNSSHLPDEFMMEQLASLPWKRYGIIPSRPIIAHADMVSLFRAFISLRLLNSRNGP